MLAKILIFIAIGIAGGLIGGMGMGGGTLLIPLLTLFTGTDQHLAQAVNLVAFIPMSAVALVIHIKNKLVEVRHVLITAIPAVAASGGASLLSKIVDGKSLSMYFGIFLTVLGLYQLASAIVACVKKHKDKKAAIATYTAEKEFVKEEED